jgi:hypothetical protein
MLRRVPEAADAVDLDGRVAHMGGEHVGEPADLAPAHGVGLAGQREGPPRPADAAGGEVAMQDGATLSVPCADWLTPWLQAVTTAGVLGPERVEGRDVGRARQPVRAETAAMSGAMPRAFSSTASKPLAWRAR